MREIKELELNKPVSIEDDEDEETLAAIGEGIRDAEAGRTFTSNEVR